MNLLPSWLRRWLRAPSAPVTRRARRTRLLLEALEDRVVPASSLSDPAYLAWQAQTFRIDDAALAPVATGAGVSASGSVSNASFGSLIGLNSVLGSTSYRGTGYTVAIIDTGVNYNDPNLGGGYGKRVIGGYNFVNNTIDPMDDNGHGTFVASEIASTSATYAGVAPNVNIVALKVLDSTGSGSFGNVQRALDWVVANQAVYHIVAVNISLGSGNYTMNPYAYLESDLAALKNNGVFTGVAAGNDYFTAGSPGLAYPAISGNVVSVGAVWDGNFGSVSWASGAKDYTTTADQIASFSQRSSALSILAPGAILTGEALKGGLTQMAGTSMATPVVVGAAVIIHEALDFASQGGNAYQSYILWLMQSTGKVIYDYNNGADNVAHTGLSFRRLDLAAAVNSIAPPTPAPVKTGPSIGAIADQTVNVGQAARLTVTATDGAGQSVAYSAQALTAVQDAFALVTQYKLAYTGIYWTNLHGLNEKWLWSYAMGGLVACILPDGTLRRYDPAGNAAMLSDANLLGRVDSAYWANPLALVGIVLTSATPPATVSIAGAQLTVTPNAGFSGPIYVVLTASTSTDTVKRIVVVNVALAGVSIGAIADQSIAAGQSATVAITTSSLSGSIVNWQAQVQTSAQTAAAAQARWQLAYTGNYWTNLHGLNEKWLWSYAMGGLVACILPDGSIRRYDAAGTSAMLSDANLLARVDPAYYANPLLLTALPMTATATGVSASAVSVATLAITGSQLTVTPAAGFSGNLFVVITASDGVNTAKKSFMVSVR